MHTAPPFCKEKKITGTQSFRRFLKTPRFTATKYGPSLAEVNFTGDTSICIYRHCKDIHLEIFYFYMHIYIYIHKFKFLYFNFIFILEFACQKLVSCCAF